MSGHFWGQTPPATTIQSRASVAGLPTSLKQLQNKGNTVLVRAWSKMRKYFYFGIFSESYVDRSEPVKGPSGARGPHIGQAWSRSGPGPWWVLVTHAEQRSKDMMQFVCVCVCVCSGVGGLGWRGIAPWLLLIAAHYNLGGSNHSGFLCVCVVCVVWVCGCVQVSRASVDSLLVLEPRFIISREISEPLLQPAHLPIKDPLKSI